VLTVLLDDNRHSQVSVGDGDGWAGD
jgi:hypothetical protein